MVERGYLRWVDDTEAKVPEINRETIVLSAILSLLRNYDYVVLEFDMKGQPPLIANEIKNMAYQIITVT